MKRHPIRLAVIALSLALAQNAAAGTLENLERERAILLETLISGDIGVEERQTRIETSRGRLIDLERMVLRDKDLVGKNTPLVQSAFDNYDLTFLVHSSVEKRRSLADHWLGEIGVSTQTLNNARMGRR